MWSAVIFDTILGGFVLGMISLLSNLYGKSSEYFYRILGFIWAVPLTLFIFVKMASRHGKTMKRRFATKKGAPPVELHWWRGQQH